MKCYVTRHKNKTPVREMDAFRAIFYFFYFLAALNAYIFYFWVTFLCYFSMAPGFFPGFSSLPALSFTLTTLLLDTVTVFNTVSEATSSILALTIQQLCYWIPCCNSGHQMLPNSFPRGAEDIPEGGKYRKHMPLLKYLAYLQPIFLIFLI